VQPGLQPLEALEFGARPVSCAINPSVFAETVIATDDATVYLWDASAKDSRYETPLSLSLLKPDDLEYGLSTALARHPMYVSLLSLSFVRAACLRSQ
jgi:hypothetical protein